MRPSWLTITFALIAPACAQAPPKNPGEQHSQVQPAPNPVQSPTGPAARKVAERDVAYSLGGSDDEIDDGAASLGDIAEARHVEAHPLDDRSDAELLQDVRDNPAALGSLSLGRPSAGRLVAGVAMPEITGIRLVDPAHCWGTQETVDYLSRAVNAVVREHPDAHRLFVGHISARNGGPLRPHKSHQSGRDVDISYYYLGDSPRWYARATKRNLDVEKTWTFIRALVVHTDVNLILIDHSIQRLLRAHAESIGEDAVWLDSLFRGVPGKQRPMIVHAKGHATHIHVRFYNPIAQESARRAYPILIRLGLAEPPLKYVHHRVKPGETLGMLARKYRTTVAAIRHANNLRSTKIIAKRRYRIPKQVSVRQPPRTSIPLRRLPPSLPSKPRPKAPSGR